MFIEEITAYAKDRDKRVEELESFQLAGAYH